MKTVISILLSVFLFGLSLIPDFPLAWLSIFGWIFFIQFISRLSLRLGLVIALLTNAILGIFGLFWLEYFGLGSSLLGILFTCWILPLCLLMTRMLGVFRFFKGFTALSWAIGWAFCALIMVWAPISTTPLLGFFGFPLVTLQLLHYLPGGLIFLTILTVLCAASFALYSESRRTRISAWLSFGLLIGITLAGIGRLFFAPQPASFLKVAAIQHNLPFERRSEDLLARLESATKKASEGNPDIIIYPLYSLPESVQYELLNETGFFSRLSAQVHALILATSRISHTVLEKNFSQNFSIFSVLFSSQGKIQDRYRSVDRSPFHDKHQYLDPHFKILDAGGSVGKFGVLICFEGERPKYAQKAKFLGARFLVIVANPGDAPYSPLPYYLLEEAQYRAIETGLPVVVATPNGFSGLIDRYGRIKPRSHLRQAETLQIDVPVS